MLRFKRQQFHETEYDVDNFIFTSLKCNCTRVQVAQRIFSLFLTKSICHLPEEITYIEFLLKKHPGRLKSLKILSIMQIPPKKRCKTCTTTIRCPIMAEKGLSLANCVPAPNRNDPRSGCSPEITPALPLFETTVA